MEAAASAVPAPVATSDPATDELATTAPAETDLGTAPIDITEPLPNDASDVDVKVAALQAALATESASTFSSGYTAELPPPFPELEHLSLAYNKVNYSLGLLATLFLCYHVSGSIRCTRVKPF